VFSGQDEGGANTLVARDELCGVVLSVGTIFPFAEYVQFI